jgi:hypothetical protein
MGTWLNSDGLYVKFGTDEGVSLADAGMFCNYGLEQTYEWDLTLSELTETEVVQNDVTVIPDDFMITKVEILTLVAAATGTAIDVGTIHISRNTSDSEWTADPDGILAAFITASMDTVGQYTMFFGSGTADAEESLPSGTTTGGVQIADVTVAPLLLTASRTTATAFTAGRIKIRITGVPAALA